MRMRAARRSVRPCCRSRASASPATRSRKAGSERVALRLASALLAPAVAVARDHRAGRTRPPCPGGVGARPRAVVAPVIQDRLDPAPRLFLLVAAHEQVQAS